MVQYGERNCFGDLRRPNKISPLKVWDTEMVVSCEYCFQEANQNRIYNSLSIFDVNFVVNCDFKQVGGSNNRFA